ncbi:MAG: aldehyde dehydrogenase family protein, partial [Candidatus Promineifilaceae bacterium]|nr:aldehyde dehydrogenase family protein [Candidatus Promineifilaceae bacterium]
MTTMKNDPTEVSPPRRMNGHRELTCINPATGRHFTSVAMATPAEIARAHREMREAAPLWRSKSPAERARILRKFQKVLIDHADEITRVINLDTGKSRQDALAELFLVVDKLQNYTKKNAEKWLRSERVPPGIYIFKKYTVERRPFGVVAVIGPWNLPLDLTLPPTYAALLAGNTVILKPSEVTPAAS